MEWHYKFRDKRKKKIAISLNVCAYVFVIMGFFTHYYLSFFGIFLWGTIQILRSADLKESNPKRANNELIIGTAICLMPIIMFTIDLLTK